MKDKENIAFAERLNIACDDHPSVPTLRNGRQTWLRDRLEDRGVEVRLQSVHRWFNGIARPYHKNMLVIAEILRVDVGWLSTGSREAEAPQIHRKLAIADNGALSLLTGLLQSKGFTVAFPEDDDMVAQVDAVHVFAIIRGRKHTFHGVRCSDMGDGELQLRIPADPVGRTTLVGVFVDEDLRCEAFVINGEWVKKSFSRSQGHYIVNFNKDELPNPNEVQPFGDFIQAASH